MKRILWAKLPIGAAMLTATAAWQLGTAGSVWAQQPYPPPPPPVVAAPAPEAPASTAMAAPSMTGPLVANPNPYSFDDPFGYFGKIYVTGAITGLALVNRTPCRATISSEAMPATPS
jgi:hypothetical protein